MQRGSGHRVHRYHVVSGASFPRFIHTYNERGWYRNIYEFGTALHCIPGPVPKAKLIQTLAYTLLKPSPTTLETLMKQTRRMND